MPVYKIPVSWSVASDYVIEAETEQEAIDKAYMLGLPGYEPEYLDDSLQFYPEEIEVIDETNYLYERKDDPRTIEVWRLYE